MHVVESGEYDAVACNCLNQFVRWFFFSLNIVAMKQCILSIIKYIAGIAKIEEEEKYNELQYSIFFE